MRMAELDGNSLRSLVWAWTDHYGETLEKADKKKVGK
jgi:hypothetical protein